MQGSIESISGPAWDNSTIYSGFEASELQADLDAAQAVVADVLGLAKQASVILKHQSTNASELAEVVQLCQEATLARNRGHVLMGNLRTFANCTLSVVSDDSAAKALFNRVQDLFSGLAAAYAPIDQYLTQCSEEQLEGFLEHPQLMCDRFMLTHRRRLQPFRLSLGEEELLIKMRVHGPLAWDNLYSEISGSLEVEIATAEGVRTVGAAEAKALEMVADRQTRRTAFEASTRAWKSQQHACAAILEGLSGWRIQECRRRSHSQPQDFLQPSLHAARIERQTLDAMMQAVAAHRPEQQQALKTQARLLGVGTNLAPWDLFAPCPTWGDQTSKAVPFEEAMEIIVGAFNQIDPEMAEFAQMMQKNRWIEGTRGPKKRPGAYCTRFAKVREPRVYMTYTGTMIEVKTLAHELGHAFHGWVMRDLPITNTYYPMTLAETASIFAEQVVMDALLDQAASPQERQRFLWTHTQGLAYTLVNVASRFTFEQRYYEARQQGESFSAAKLCDLMEESWREWYGDSLCEMDRYFWASKLHFSMSGVSFYNYPYIFGLLFSLGVYGQREKMGAGFFPAYKELLRDTGRMSAEDVARIHLGVDLGGEEFWQGSLATVSRILDNFSSLSLEQLG